MKVPKTMEMTEKNSDSFAIILYHVVQWKGYYEF